MPIMVTGAAGQDGGYLCELLLGAGQEIVPVIHPKEQLPVHFNAISSNPLSRVESCDLADPATMRHLLREIKPSKVFHLAALSHPGFCADNPILSQAVNVTSAEVIVDWLQRDGRSTKLLLVSSAAIFGHPQESPQTEQTPENPIGLYGKQKQALRGLAKHARAQGLFVSCAIPYNHESPRRTEDFVIAKIVNSVARIKLGQQERLELGDLTPRRDWGYAPEYVQAFTWMLEVPEPSELIIATGETNSVGAAANLALECAGLDPGVHLASDPNLRRQDDPQDSVGDPSKAWRELGWEAKTKFAALVPLLFKFAIDRHQANSSA